jgi:hypothetical protein
MAESSEKMKNNEKIENLENDKSDQTKKNKIIVCDDVFLQKGYDVIDEKSCADYHQKKLST